MVTAKLSISVSNLQRWKLADHFVRTSMRSTGQEYGYLDGDTRFSLVISVMEVLSLKAGSLILGSKSDATLDPTNNNGLASILCF